MFLITFSTSTPIGSPSSFIFNGIFFAALSALLQRNRVTQSFKYTKQSAANMISAIRQYLFFVYYFRLQVLPASVDTVACFLEFMGLTSSYGHLKHLLSAVKFLHLAYDLNFPTTSFMLDMTMQGLKRRLARVPFQVLPLNPRILRSMYKHLNMDRNEDLALWCAYLVAFYGLLRKKNVVPEGLRHDPMKVLSRRHFLIDPEDNKVYMYIGFSKTNQFGAKDLVLPIPGNSDPALDPVRHIQELFRRVDASPSSPAFSYSPGRYISYSVFTRRLKTLLVKSGYPASQYSGHSFRRGGASYLHACGGSALMVQAAGDWASNCFTRYIFLSLEDRLKAQLLMCTAISHSC